MEFNQEQKLLLARETIKTLRAEDKISNITSDSLLGYLKDIRPATIQDAHELLLKMVKDGQTYIEISMLGERYMLSLGVTPKGHSPLR